MTLDINPEVDPDLVWDLNEIPLPFADNSFDGIVAEEVLEHLGKQGDYKFFFDQFGDFWRILKPGGSLCFTCPRHDSPWAWGDPGHTRVLTLGTITFLQKAEYEKQQGQTTMTDYRNVMGKQDWLAENAYYSESGLVAVLRAIGKDPSPEGNG